MCRNTPPPPLLRDFRRWWRSEKKSVGAPPPPHQLFLDLRNFGCWRRSEKCVVPPFFNPGSAPAPMYVPQCGRTVFQLLILWAPQGHASLSCRSLGWLQSIHMHPDMKLRTEQTLKETEASHSSIYSVTEKWFQKPNSKNLGKFW